MKLRIIAFYFIAVIVWMISIQKLMLGLMGLGSYVLSETELRGAAIDIYFRTWAFILFAGGFYLLQIVSKTLAPQDRVNTEKLYCALLQYLFKSKILLASILLLPFLSMFMLQFFLAHISTI